MKKKALLIMLVMPLLSSGAIDNYTSNEDFNEDPFGTHWILIILVIIWGFYTFMNKDKNN